MAYRGKEIVNPKTKQHIKFLKTRKDTDGLLLEMEATWQGHSVASTEHYHPFQEEFFKVIEGEMTIKIQGQLKKLSKGDTLHIPQNTTHAMWNSSDKKAVVNWQVRPALDMENLLETAAGLASEGKTNASGRPNFLQGALMANKYANVFRLSRPAFPVQKVLFLALTPFAWLAGLRPTYEHYID